MVKVFLVCVYHIKFHLGQTALEIKYMHDQLSKHEWYSF